MTGASLSTGPRRMVARVAAAVPFAAATQLLADLAGIRLSPKRVERSAEADGQAANRHPQFGRVQTPTRQARRDSG